MTVILKLFSLEQLIDVLGKKKIPKRLMSPDLRRLCGNAHSLRGLYMHSSRILKYNEVKILVQFVLNGPYPQLLYPSHF